MKLPIITFLLLFSEILNAQIVEYPLSPKIPVTDTFYNHIIVDNYRWLENRNENNTVDWISSQNKTTKNYLKKASFKYNSYNVIDKYSYVKYENPQKEGKYYFVYAYYNNYANPALFFQTSLYQSPSILVDPNFISKKDAIVIKAYSISENNKLLAYQFSRNGSDWTEIKVININTGRHATDHLHNIKFSSISWKDDGFFYSSFLYNEDSPTIGQEIHYHKLGTNQDQDDLIFRRKNNPNVFFNSFVTSNKRFLIIKETNEISGLMNIFYKDLDEINSSLKPLITRLNGDENIEILDVINNEFICTSFKGVNNGMIIKISPENPRKWKTLIPEYKESLLLEVKLLKDKLIAIYQADGKQQLVFFNYMGEVLHAIQIPFGFAVKGFNCEIDDEELLFSYSGYTMPKVVYILNTASFEMKPLKATVVNFDFKQFESKEIIYKSRDSVDVSLNIIYCKKTVLQNSNPLLLSAYGGFGSIVTPHFSAGIVHFLKKGGVYAIANIRGGGDRGKEWALAGKGLNKMNSFNDFIDAAEYLIDNKYTSTNKLAITGASNGGLVVAVAMIKRPELFAAVVPLVAPLDMLRFEKFTIGHLHTDEYGSIYDSIGFENLHAYSPYHNIKDSINYPSTMIMTSDNDDRVPPLHSYKFAAKLQNNPAQKNPIVLRIEKNAGHSGATMSFKSILREDAAFYDFVLYNLQMD